MRLHELPAGTKFTHGQCVYEAEHHNPYPKRLCRRLLYNQDGKWYIENCEAVIWFEDMEVQVVTINIEVTPC